MMASKRRRLLEILRQTSFKQSDSKSFHLSSGIDSRYYVDCKQALSHPEARKLIGELIFELVRNDSFDTVGGLELGAYPIACAVSDKIYAEKGRSVRVFVVRKTAKEHGIRKLVAGDVHKGDIALIVDDVITSGQSAIQAIQGVRDEGLKVARVIALVDREESDGRKNIEREGVGLEALFTLKDLISDDDDSERSDPRARHKRPGASGQSARSAATS